MCWIQKSSKYRDLVLVLNVQTLNTRPVFSIAKNQKAYIALNDNSRITLNSAFDNLGDAEVNLIGDNVVTTGTAYGYYELTKADVEKLTSLSVTAVSIETTDGNFDYDIKPKNADLIKKELELISKAK